MTGVVEYRCLTETRRSLCSVPSVPLLRRPLSILNIVFIITVFLFQTKYFLSATISRAGPYCQVAKNLAK